MHKTYLNSEEIKIIKGADKIIDKIGGFPSMENGYLKSYSVKQSDKFNIDVELVFNLNGWLDTLDFWKGRSSEYDHKVFNERNIRINFHNCHHIDIKYPMFHCGEIKFGGSDEKDERNRKQDVLPGMSVILDRPYCCFYICSGNELILFFDEKECEISAELLD